MTWVVVVLLVLILLTQESVVGFVRALLVEARATRFVEPPLTRDEAQYLAASGNEEWYESLVGSVGRDVAVRALRDHTARLARETERWAHLGAPEEGEG